ncbi:MAG: lactate utilization protein B/C [Flavobacterium sp.]
MNFFKKIFGSSDAASDAETESEYGGNPTTPDSHLSIDERFIFNFKKNGGKFLYCENKQEVTEQFENILEENDWFENEVLCYEPGLFSLLEENKLIYISPRNPKFLLATCENLIADEGSILFSSKQIRQDKPNELPANIVIIATTSQILSIKSDGLSAIKRKYERDYPTNITTIKYFEKAKEEDFTQYGSVAKNLYLLLLEDL